MVDGQKQQILLETLNVTNQDLYPNIYAFLTVLIMPVSMASSERSFSAIHRVKRLSLELQWVMRDYQRSEYDKGRFWPNLRN